MASGIINIYQLSEAGYHMKKEKRIKLAIALIERLNKALLLLREARKITRSIGFIDYDIETCVKLIVKHRKWFNSRKRKSKYF